MTRNERMARFVLRAMRGMGYDDAAIARGVRVARITNVCGRRIEHGHDHAPLIGCTVHGFGPQDTTTKETVDE